MVTKPSSIRITQKNGKFFARLPHAREQGAKRVQIGEEDGRSKSSVQRNHVGTGSPGDVVGPLLHHRSPTLEQIGALIGRLNSFDDMGETGFGHFS